MSKLIRKSGKFVCPNCAELVNSVLYRNGIPMCPKCHTKYISKKNKQYDNLNDEDKATFEW